MKDEELREIFANHGVYDGKESLYFKEDVDSFIEDVMQLMKADREANSPLFAEYRNHLCVVKDDLGGGEYELEAIADEMTDGSYSNCDHAKYQFFGVRPVTFYRLTQSHQPTKKERI